MRPRAGNYLTTRHILCSEQFFRWCPNLISTVKFLAVAAIAGLVAILVLVAMGESRRLPRQDGELQAKMRDVGFPKDIIVVKFPKNVEGTRTGLQGVNVGWGDRLNGYRDHSPDSRLKHVPLFDWLRCLDNTFGIEWLIGVDQAILSARSEVQRRGLPSVYDHNPESEFRLVHPDYLGISQPYPSPLIYAQGPLSQLYRVSHVSKLSHVDDSHNGGDYQPGERRIWPMQPSQFGHLLIAIRCWFGVCWLWSYCYWDYLHVHDFSRRIPLLNVVVDRMRSVSDSSLLRAVSSVRFDAMPSR
jgi:hypothetical protein